MVSSAAQAFNVTAAVLAAGFAFEAYNEPSERDARWERGADGCDVAFMSDAFARECYSGILEVRLCEAKELAKQDELAQALISGSERDPYVIFAMNEENEKGPKEGAIGLGRAVDRARSSTVWSKSLADAWKDKGKEGGAMWPEDERVFLYVKDPSRAQLALTVFDEEVLKEDVPLGATSVHLGDLLKPSGRPSEREWSGWVPLTWRPSETQDNTVMIGAVAGAAVAGPVGAAAGGFLGSLIKKPVQGQLRLELKYTPLSEVPPSQQRQLTERGVAAAGEAEDAGANENGPGADADVDAKEEAEDFVPILASGSAPRGGSAGIDWSVLSRQVADESAAYELCCFLTHRDTSSEAAIWRDCDRRLLVLAFRGTSDIMDVLTDVGVLQTPLEQGFEKQESDDPRRVHSGFFNSARAVNRRLKELIVSACAGTPGEWDLLVTGHSLGGAIAQLIVTELVGDVDTSRGFKERADSSLLARAGRMLNVGAVGGMFKGGAPVSLGTVRLYTFGAPRVGNAEFARHFEETFDGLEAFRIVNDRDIVPRLPRGSGVAGKVLEYEHVGRTVLIAEQAAEADGFNGFWVEGASDDASCPLRDASPLSNPFSSGQILGDVTEQASGFASKAWGKIDAAAKGKSREQLQQAFAEATEDFGRTRDLIGERLKKMNPLEAVTMIGLDKEFVESELKLAESIGQGTALEHHLEPSYFLAMSKALDASRS
jgi:hypothetical protein